MYVSAGFCNIGGYFIIFGIFSSQVLSYHRFVLITANNVSVKKIILFLKLGTVFFFFFE